MSWLGWDTAKIDIDAGIGGRIDHGGRAARRQVGKACGGLGLAKPVEPSAFHHPLEHLRMPSPDRVFDQADASDLRIVGKGHGWQRGLIQRSATLDKRDDRGLVRMGGFGIDGQDRGLVRVKVEVRLFKPWDQVGGPINPTVRAGEAVDRFFQFFHRLRHAGFGAHIIDHSLLPIGYRKGHHLSRRIGDASSILVLELPEIGRLELPCQGLHRFWLDPIFMRSRQQYPSCTCKPPMHGIYRVDG